MESYFKQRALIPEGNLIEIKFEDFEQQPLKFLKKIYKSLNLKGFNNNQDQFVSYLKSISNYQKNSYRFTQKVISVITKSWSGIIDKLDYSIPQTFS
jgi:uncharacterized protein (UPF0297 family)